MARTGKSLAAAANRHADCAAKKLFEEAVELFRTTCRQQTRQLTEPSVDHSRFDAKRGQYLLADSTGLLAVVNVKTTEVRFLEQHRTSWSKDYSGL
jgi:hypothetical protein